jgi:hypothetical protein
LLIHPVEKTHHLPNPVPQPQALRDSLIAVDDGDHAKLQKLTSSDRRVIREGALVKTGETGERLVQAWLFDDVMIYAKPLPGTGKFQLQRWFDLRLCKVSWGGGSVVECTREHYILVHRLGRSGR